MRTAVRIALAGVAMLGAGPASADVKAGTLAWQRGDWQAAVEQWRGPAIAGDPDAQFDMGQAYKLGRGVPTDMAQAESWYAKAAAQGHAPAQDNYGLALFQNGRKADAVPWLEKSVARDEKRAELVMGTMLFNGDAVTRDWARAYGLITRSSQQGQAQASQTLAQMDGFVTPEQREQGLQLASQLAATSRINAVAPQLAGSAPVVPAGRPLAGSPRVPHGHAPAPDASTATEAPVDTPKPAVRVTTVPPTSGPVIAARKPVVATPEPVATTPKATGTARKPATAKLKPLVAVAKTAAVARPAPKPVAAAGRWRIQLGAFRDAGNAKSLWARIGGKSGGAPIYTVANGVTRLQAGPFATEAAATKACKAAGAACDVVPTR